MENNFDKHIKRLMQDYEAEYKASDWSLMEDKINEEANLNPEIEDVYLDGMAFDSLHNLEETYNPDHWALMREKLDARYAFRRKLMRYKVLEVALVALFIFTLVQYLPIKKSNHNNLAETNNTEQTIDQSSQSETPTVVTTPSKNNDPKTINESSLINPLVSIASGSVTNDNTLSENNTTTTILSGEEQSSSAEFENTSELVIVEKISTDKLNTAEDQDNSSTDLSDYDLSLINPLALKESNRLVIADIEELNGHNIFTNLKQPIKIRIGMLLGPDANYVMTPSSESLGFDVLNQYVVGYTGGFSLGFKYDRLEVETGALYSYVSYGSRNVFEIKGSFAAGGYVQQGLVGAELDIVRLPLNLKYNFFERGKWNVYAFSGVSANLTVESFYNYITQDLGSSNASRNFANPAIPPEGIPELTPKTYDGIFEGGSFSDNTFFTGNVGFGIERYFTPRMSIFFQPSYNHQFTKGLGPQADQINSLSILTGAKVTLKKRKKLKKY